MSSPLAVHDGIWVIKCSHHTLVGRSRTFIDGTFYPFPFGIPEKSQVDECGYVFMVRIIGFAKDQLAGSCRPFPAKFIFTQPQFATRVGKETMTLRSANFLGEFSKKYK